MFCSDQKLENQNGKKGVPTWFQLDWSSIQVERMHYLTNINTIVTTMPTTIVCKHETIDLLSAAASSANHCPVHLITSLSEVSMNPRRNFQRTILRHVVT